MPDLAETLGVDAPETIETVQAATISMEPDVSEQQPEAAPLAVKVETRPDGLPDQYWNDDTKEINVGSLVKSLSDTQTALRNKTPEAPAEYAVELSEEATKLLVGDGKAIDDPLVKMAVEWAKETGQSQESFNGLLKGFEGVITELSGNQQTPEEKVEQLLGTLKTAYGSEERAKAAVTGLSNFINAAIPEEGSVREAAVAFAQTPEGFPVMDAIRKQVKDRVVPTTQTPTERISPQDEYSDLATKQAQDKITPAELRRKNELQLILDRQDMAENQQVVVTTVPIR